MKKLLIFTLSLILVFSFGILANGQGDMDQVGLDYWDTYMANYGEDSGQDGGTFVWDTDSNDDKNQPSKYTILNGYAENNKEGGNKGEHLGIKNRFGNYSFAGAGDQEVVVSIDVKANIPCYLGMTLTGNLGYATGTSVGISEEETIDLTSEESIIMLFDDEVGGFVDASWNSLGHMGHPDPSDGVYYYLRSCDMFKVDLVANTPYKYSVILTDELENDNSNVLPMDVRTSGNGGTSWSQYNGLDSLNEEIAWNFNSNRTLYHDFRVPYTNQPTGQYEGEITFKAVTL